MRYWAVPGRQGFEHILGGLEKDNKTGAISTDPENHNLMTHLRQEKIDKIPVPDLEVLGDKDDADLLIVGFGGTYGHLHAAMDEMRAEGKKVAKNIFNVFIANNGLAAQKNEMPQVEATIVNPELEDK